MRKFEFDELIEKVFSIGYEYALEEQREFGNKENKRKRKEWEWKEADKIGQKMMRDGVEMSKGDAIRALRLKNLAETHGGVGRYFDGEGNKYDIYSDALIETATKNGKGRNVHHRINTRSITKDKGEKLTRGSFIKDENQDCILSDLTSDPHVNSHRYETMRTGGKRKKVFKDNIEENSDIKKNILNKKNLKRAGLALIGTAAAASVAYGAKKLYDKKKKKKQKEQNKEKEED